MNNKEYYELIVNVTLLKTIGDKDVLKVIEGNINKAIGSSEYLKRKSRVAKAKLYVANQFYPVEAFGVYKKGSTYSFSIRSIDREFISFLTNPIRLLNSKDFYIVSANSVTRPVSFISNLSMTDLVVIKDNKVENLRDKINKHMIKKFESYYKTKIDKENNFIEKLFKACGQIKIQVKEDELSQRLGHMALATGYSSYIINR